jgi:hypothetical protein
MAAAAALTWSSSVTSSSAENVPRSSAIFLAASPFLSAMTTRAPLATKSAAQAAPIPLAPPVTTANAPVNRMSIAYPLLD